MLEFLSDFRTLNTASVCLRLLLAMLVGGVIGIERGRKGRAAGFRTYMLVCLGAALTMLLGQYQSTMLATRWLDVFGTVNADITRFSAQVINGVGFLGAGTIIVTGRQEVKGLTTAAGLWASACVGLSIGAGFYECVVLGFLLILLCVCLLPAVENLLVANSRNMNVYVEFRSLDDLGSIINCIKAQDVQIYEVDIDHGRNEYAHNPNATFAIRLHRKQMHSEVLAALSALDHILIINEV